MRDDSGNWYSYPAQVPGGHALEPGRQCGSAEAAWRAPGPFGRKTWSSAGAVRAAVRARGAAAVLKVCPWRNPNPGAEIARSELRASHDDRDRVVELLRGSAGDGRLTAGAPRRAAWNSAMSGADLRRADEAWVADLPAEGAVASPAIAPAAKEVARIDIRSWGWAGRGAWSDLGRATRRRKWALRLAPAFLARSQKAGGEERAGSGRWAEFAGAAEGVLSLRSPAGLGPGRARPGRPRQASHSPRRDQPRHGRPRRPRRRRR